MIYLDYSATTPLDKEVLNQYYKLCENYFANSSSNHVMGREANNFLRAARKQIASLLQVVEDEVYFTSGATESNNISIIGVAFANAKKGKHLITTKIEHPSVLNVFKYLETNCNFNVTYLNVNNQGVISLDELGDCLSEKTTLVSIMGVNNEIGSIMPINEIGKLVKEKSEAYFHVDATQMIGKLKIDLSNIDLLTFSAHKIHGLKGSGALIKKEHVKLESIMFGGHQEGGIRPGTVNWQADVLLAKTLRKALEDMEDAYNHVKSLHAYLFDELSKISNVYLNSSINGSPFIINFSLKGYPSEVIVSALEEEGYIVSTLSACSMKKVKGSHVIEALNLEPFRAKSSVRVSLDKSVKKEELVGFVNTLKLILTRIPGGSF